MVEFGAVVGDQARENIEASGGALLDSLCRKYFPAGSAPRPAERCRRSLFRRTGAPVRSTRVMRSSLILASTVLFGPGRKLARTRCAMSPRRRSRLAGWMWSGLMAGAALMFPRAIRLVISCEGRIPVVRGGGRIRRGTRARFQRRFGFDSRWTSWKVILP
jgi:hypothetical protein